MARTLLAATAALTLMTGVALAETTTSTTTTETTVPYIAPVPVPAPAPTTETVTRRTVDSDGDGVVHSKTVTTGTAVSPFGDRTTTQKTIETNTVR